MALTMTNRWGWGLEMHNAQAQRIQMRYKQSSLCYLEISSLSPVGIGLRRYSFNGWIFVSCRNKWNLTFNFNKNNNNKDESKRKIAKIKLNIHRPTHKHERIKINLNAYNYIHVQSQQQTKHINLVLLLSLLMHIRKDTKFCELLLLFLQTTNRQTEERMDERFVEYRH